MYKSINTMIMDFTRFKERNQVTNQMGMRVELRIKKKLAPLEVKESEASLETRKEDEKDNPRKGRKENTIICEPLIDKDSILK